MNLWPWGGASVHGPSGFGVLCSRAQPGPSSAKTVMAYVALRASPGKGEAHSLLQLASHLGTVLCHAPEKDIAHESGGHFSKYKMRLTLRETTKQS